MKVYRKICECGERFVTTMQSQVLCDDCISDSKETLIY